MTTTYQGVVSSKYAGSLSGQNQHGRSIYTQSSNDNLSELQRQYDFWMQMLLSSRSESIQGVSGQNQSYGTSTVSASGGGLLSSLGNAVIGGAVKVGEAVDKVKSWFISQIKGKANKNEDASINNGNCGPTVLAMILLKHGLEALKKDPNGLIERVRLAMGGGTKEEGKKSWTNGSQIAQGSREYGLNATSTSKNTVEDVQNALGENKDVIALIRPNGPQSGHFVIVRKISGNTVYLADPSKQGFTQMSLQEFTQKFGDGKKDGYMTTIS